MFELSAFLILLLLALSASFSSFETALFSLSPLQRARLKETGGISPLIPKLLERPRDLLTTILFGNELVNVAIAILGGTLAYHLFPASGRWTVYLVSIAVTTLVLLIFGEIVPKNVAVRFPLVLSQVLIVPYQLFSWLVFPLRVLLTKIADSLVRLFGADPRKGRRYIVEEELRDLLELGKKEGTLADLERTFIQNALDLSSLRISEVMTPRHRMVAISVSKPFSEILKVLEENRYSRLPVYERNLNQILGVVHAKELLPLRVRGTASRPPGREGGSPNLRDYIKSCPEVAPEETLDRLFQEFQRRRMHLGIVKDSAGNVMGLVTMDDLLRRFFP